MKALPQLWGGTGASPSELGGLGGADEGESGGGAIGADGGDSVKVAGAHLALVLGRGITARLRSDLGLHRQEEDYISAVSEQGGNACTLYPLPEDFGLTERGWPLTHRATHLLQNVSRNSRNKLGELTVYTVTY